jgi:hypothetical protein
MARDTICTNFIYIWVTIERTKQHENVLAQRPQYAQLFSLGSHGL